MSIISKETWYNMPEKEKRKIIEYYKSNGLLRTTNKHAIEILFGKENLQPKFEPKIKTWADIAIHKSEIWDKIYDVITAINECSIIGDKLSNKLIATAKIAKLIELGYGGMVTEEENSDNRIKKYVPFYYGEKGFVIECLYRSQDSILCFHTQQQAEEFMSYSENRTLIEQYYMI